jgi:hypothetical protein
VSEEEDTVVLLTYECEAGGLHVEIARGFVLASRRAPRCCICPGGPNWHAKLIARYLAEHIILDAQRLVETQHDHLALRTTFYRTALFREVTFFPTAIFFSFHFSDALFTSQFLFFLVQFSW